MWSEYIECLPKIFECFPLAVIIKPTANWRHSGFFSSSHLIYFGSYQTQHKVYETPVGIKLTLTLWMLGNFLNIDYIVVCFLKPFNSACFFMGNDGLSSKQVGSQASRRVTRRLAWIQPVCISINVVPELKGLNFILHIDNFISQPRSQSTISVPA